RHPSTAFLDKLAQMAAHDPSAWVRRYLASGLQRLALTDRWRIAEGLVHHADSDDLNLPLLNWYGIESLVNADRDKAVSLIAKAKIPLIREYLARRLTLLEMDVAGGLGGSAGTSPSRGLVLLIR